MSNINSILPDYYQHKIAVIGKRNFFIDYRDALVESIRQYGLAANAYEEMDEALEDRPTCVVTIAPTLYPVPKDRSIIWIMIQTEQLFNNDNQTEQVFFNGNLKQIRPYLKAYDIILDLNKTNIIGLKNETKAIVRHFPEGWYPALEKFKITEKKDKPEYDLIFIGNMPGVDDRRKRLLGFLSEKYRVYPIRNDLWNEKKSEALANSKICLNIHFDESRYMEMRLFEYFAYECFVLSEPMYFTSPFVEGEDYIEFFWTDICPKIDYYLENENLRKEIAQNAYKKLRNNTLYKSTKTLIDCLLLESYNRYRIKNNSVNSKIKSIMNSMSSKYSEITK